MFEIAIIAFITISLTEIVKLAKFINRKHAPLFAVGCAILLVAGYGANNIRLYIDNYVTLSAVVSGAAIGLISCGAYSFAQCLFSLANNGRAGRSSLQ